MLQCSVKKDGNWPVRESELTHRYLKQFIRYINTIDFEKINLSNEQIKMKTVMYDNSMQYYIL